MRDMLASSEADPKNLEEAVAGKRIMLKLTKRVLAPPARPPKAESPTAFWR